MPLIARSFLVTLAIVPSCSPKEEPTPEDTSLSGFTATSQTDLEDEVNRADPVVDAIRITGSVTDLSPLAIVDEVRELFEVTSTAALTTSAGAGHIANESESELSVIIDDNVLLDDWTNEGVTSLAGALFIGNPVLETITFTSVTEIGELRIFNGHPRLRSISLPALARVDTLEINGLGPTCSIELPSLEACGAIDIVDAPCIEDAQIQVWRNICTDVTDNRFEASAR